MTLFTVTVAVAVVAIGAIVLVAGGQIAPHTPSWQLLLGAALVAGAVFLLAFLHAFITGGLHQLLLKCGAIDTQWLWAPDDPEGFKRQWRQTRPRR